MSLEKISVKIEGDYVDSYIYSGYLFLVDHKYIVSIYKWEALIDCFLEGIDACIQEIIKPILKDSRKTGNRIDIPGLGLSKENLSRFKLFSYEIGVWPSDINIYSNVLYISSENGVSSIKFDWDKGELRTECRIFDEMSFGVSPNSGNRLAIAAGKNGVLTYIPISRNKNTGVTQLFENTCLDIDWQSTALIANTISGVCRADFTAMPNKGDYDSDNDYYRSIQRIKKIQPKVSTLENLKNAWVAGDKMFFLSKNGEISFNNLEKSEQEEKNVSGTVVKGSVLRARTGAFGTVVETEDRLYSVTNEGVEPLSGEPVSWRVFPRARNYVNQLHIVNDDFLEINIINSSSAINDFGFYSEDIDFIG